MLVQTIAKLRFTSHLLFIDKITPFIIVSTKIKMMYLEYKMKKTLVFMIVLLLALQVMAEEMRMNAEIVNVYRQEIPATRFIGKKYFAEDSVNGSYGALWDLWFEKGWFDEITKRTDEKKSKYLFDEIGVTFGLMRDNTHNGEPFEYWIGVFMPENTTIPEGFVYHDFPKSSLGICWVHGTEPDIYWFCGKVRDKLTEEQFIIIPDEHGAYWTYEGYVCPRFTEPDEQGKKTLDRAYFVK